MDAGNRGQKAQAPVASRLASQALGREPNLSDWLTDIDLRVGLLFLNPSDRELSAIFAARFKHRLDSALENWQEITKRYQPNSERERQELGRMTDALQRAKTFSTSSGTTLSVAIYDECDLEVDQLKAEQKKFIAEWTAFLNLQDMHLTSEQMETYSIIEQATKINFGERGSLLREARNHLTTYCIGVDNVPSIVRFLHGWTLYQIAQDPEEAKEIFSKLKDLANPSFSSYLAFRLLSQFACNAGNNPRAGSWTRSALDIQSDAELHLESALQMTTLTDPSKPMELIGKALMERPGSVLRLLSDPRCLNLDTGATVNVIMTSLERIRQEGRGASTRWSEIALEISGVQDKFPGLVTVPYDLANGHKQNLQKIDVADLISAGHLFRNAVQCGSDLSMAAQTSLMGELMRRSNAVSLARKATDSVAGAREHRVEQARLAYEAAKAQADSSTVTIDAQTTRTEKLAINIAIGGCGMFMLFVFANAGLDADKYPIGLNKPFGMAMVGLALSLVGLGGWLYMDAQMKSTATQRKLKVTVKDAAKALDQSSKEADDVYREQINVNRKILADAEESLKVAENAAKKLQLDETKFEKQPQKAA